MNQQNPQQPFPQPPQQSPHAPAPGLPADAPTNRFDTFLEQEALRGAGFTDEDVDLVLGAAGDPAASPAARAADAKQDAEERRKIVEAAEIMYFRRARASVTAVRKAMERSGSPFFLPTCPEGKSSERCPLARRLGFRVHYLWDNHSDQVMFGLRLNGGLGQPRYYVVQGAPPVSTQRNPNIPPYDRHMAAVNATRQLAYELGLAPDAVVDTATNRISVGQNTLVYCKLDEFDAWWDAQRASDQQMQQSTLDGYVETLEASGASRWVTPFVATIGEIADRKAHAERPDRPFSGQVGGFRTQRGG